MGIAGTIRTLMHANIQTKIVLLIDRLCSRCFSPDCPRGYGTESHRFRYPTNHCTARSRKEWNTWYDTYSVAWICALYFTVAWPQFSSLPASLNRLYMIM